jgi:dienelactone hydrolase
MIDQTYIIKIKAIGELPTLHLFRDDRQPKPIVIYGHGFRSHSRRHLERLYKLAESGFYVFALDAEGHGLRAATGTPHIPTRDEDPWTADIFFNSLFKLSSEIETSLARLEEQSDLHAGQADLTRIGAMGVSMGGYLAWHLASKLSAVKAICPLIATPEWKFYDSWSGIGLKPETAARVELESPHQRPQAFREKAVQIHSATEDQISPISGSRAFYHTLNALGDCDVEFHTYRANHEVSSLMINRSIDFLRKHLIQSSVGL